MIPANHDSRIEVQQLPRERFSPVADLRLMRSQVADVACNVCIWDERRAEFDPTPACRDFLAN
jgi:hypothetical protein